MRRPRFNRPIFWHVMARGARRLGLFWDDQDFQFFLDLLRVSSQKADVKVAAYTLMTNHFHLVLEATSLELTTCMRRLDYGYSRFHNEKHELSGHTFDGPYQAFPLPTPRLAFRKLAYVFMNPVRAGIPTSAAGYRWSNIGDYLGQPKPPLSGTLTPFLNRVVSTAAEARILLERDLDLESARRDRRKVGLPTAREVQGLHYEWLRDLAFERRQLLEGENPVAVAMLWARQCGVSPSAIAQVEPDESAAGISRDLWRLRERLQAAGKLERVLALAS